MPFGPAYGNDRGANSDIRIDGADLFTALSRDAPDEHYLHIRVIAPGGSVIDQQYHIIGELKANGFEIALPAKYDGQANVYYGVATRTRKEGTGAAAGSVGVIYCDEITKSAPDIPPFSYMVETSAGKVQAYYLLDVPTTDLRCAELLSQRLGQAVGGDTVWDRARILRVPGFLNVKLEHPEHPRAYLLERNPDLRYSLEELESVLPALPAGDQDLPHGNIQGRSTRMSAHLWLRPTRTGAPHS